MGRQAGGDTPGKWYREGEQVEEEAQSLQVVCVEAGWEEREGSRNFNLI